MDAVLKNNRKRLFSNRTLYRKRLIKQNIPLYAMFLPIIATYILFRYLPMFGLVTAFQDFNIADGFLNSPWVGLKHFKYIFTAPDTRDVIQNTLLLGVMRVFIGFPFPIIMALLLNEVRNSSFKRWVQTLVYLPHFFSWVIIGGVVVTVFSQDNGIVNIIYSRITGNEAFPFLYNEKSWTAIFIGSAIWKEAGFSAIIYLAALAGIDPGQYEAATIDGANKFKQLLNVTIPGIMPTVVLLFVLSVGHISDVAFDQIYVMQNQAVNSTADVVSTYVYRIGLGNGMFSMPAALGMFQSILNFTLLILANTLARRKDMGLW